jgi:hypothetical protein
MTQLEQSIMALIDQHGLLNLSICGNVYDDGSRRYFDVSMQWPDADRPHGRGCVSETGDTIAEALSNTLAKMAAIRTVTLADEALPIGEAA